MGEISRETAYNSLGIDDVVAEQKKRLEEDLEIQRDHDATKVLEGLKIPQCGTPFPVNYQEFGTTEDKPQAEWVASVRAVIASRKAEDLAALLQKCSTEQQLSMAKYLISLL